MGRRGGKIRRRGRPPRKRVNKRRVAGLPPIVLLQQMLPPLRAAYDHPNRELFFDDLLIAMLLAFFNPVAHSLRGIEDVTALAGTQQRLGIPTVKRSTFSDAMKLFDPHLLRPLIEQLRGQVKDTPRGRLDPTLKQLVDRLVAYDGSYFRAATDITFALQQRHGQAGAKRAKVRLNLHLSVGTGVPLGVSIAGRDDPGEPQAMVDGAQAGQIIVADRGCFSHDALQQLQAKRVDFVLRLQSGVKCEVIAERELTAADRAAGVISDQTVRLTGCKNKHAATPLRLVTIQPADSSDRDDTQATPSPLRLLTNLDDLSIAAWMIGYVYQRRWEVELYFRWLKCWAKWDHLLSHSASGMQMQFYVAIIGTLLLSLASGRAPDSYSFRLMVMHMQGLASLEEIQAVLARRHAQVDRDKATRERRKNREG